eukprot:6488817-Pyramimonas_sp.AAC.1
MGLRQRKFDSQQRKMLRGCKFVVMISVSAPLLEPKLMTCDRYRFATQVLFLGEMEEILELTQAAEFIKTMGPMFRQIA